MQLLKSTYLKTNLEDTVQGTKDSAENQKENPALMEEGSWVLQEVAAETQLEVKEVHVCVGVEVCGVLPMKDRGEKQKWVRKTVIQT